MKRFLIILMSLFSMSSFAQANNFEAGQIWSYHTRSGEEGSTILINKVENYPKLGKVFHISIQGTKVNNPSASNRIQTDLPHLPVSETTLEKSVIDLQQSEAPINPEYRQGYKIWKAAYDKEEAGIFTIPVAEIIDFVEHTLHQ